MNLRLILCGFLTLARFAETISAEEGPPFKIGVLVCMTGVCAEVGQSSRRGAELAAAEINAAGGVLNRKIALEMQDTREAVMGAEAVTAFRNLWTDRSIQYFMGPTWTAAALSLAPIAARTPDIVITSPSLGVADFNEAGENIFNVWPHDDIGTKALARYALKQGWKRVGILSNQQAWCAAQGRAFRDEFENRGGTVTVLEESLPDASEANAETIRIARSAPDAVFISNYMMMGVVASKLRSLNYHGPIITILMDRTQSEIANGALEGALYAGYTGATTDFTRRYEAAYKEKPGVASATGYDVIQLYARAITEAKTFDPALVKHTLLKQRYAGASGEVIFDEKGGVKKTPLLYRVKGLDSELVGPLD